MPERVPMHTGRYLIHRGIKVIRWIDNQDGTRTGVIKVQHFKDAALIEPLAPPTFYKGTVEIHEIRTPEDSYRDALEIIKDGKKIDESEAKTWEYPE